MKHRYSEKQLNMLRSALIDYRDTGKEERGKPYSWNDVSNAIKDKIGVDIPHQNLSKFAQGIPARSNSSKSEREYPKKLADDGLDHILTFFTDDIDGELVQINKREFELGKTETKWPEHLQSYFNDAEYHSIIDSADLAGVYHSDGADGEQYKLTIEPDSAKDLMSFKVCAITAGKEFLGWLVKSSQEQTVLIGRDNDDFDSHVIYFIQGFDNKLYRKSSADMLLIYNYNQAVDQFTLPDEQEDILSYLQSKMLNDLYVFTKEVTT